MFVVAPDGSGTRRRIKIGRRNAEQVEMLSGLTAGERVITSDYSGLERIDRIDLTQLEGSSMLKLAEHQQGLPHTEVETLALDRIFTGGARRRVRRHHGPVRLRQVDPAQHAGPARHADQRQLFGSSARRSRGCSEKELTPLRRGSIGFVFQSFNLIDDLNVAENVEVALLYRGVPAASAAAGWRRRWNGSASATAPSIVPQQLSGGQQQRVAVARALVSDPEV